MRKYFFSLLVGFVLVLQPWVAKAAVSINVNPGAYTGQWQIIGVTTILTGSQSVSINPGNYQIQVASSNFGRFSINVAANGDVTSLNTGAANGVGNVLTFNTTLLTIDPAAYGNGTNRNGDYALLGVTGGVRTFNNPGPATYTVVPNLGYMVQVGDSANGRFNIDVAANGNVTSQNTAAAIGVGNVLTFNSTLLTIDPAAYGNGTNRNGDYSLLGVTAGVRTFNNPGPQTYTVVPNLGYIMQVADSANGRFNIDVAANGNVTSQNTAAASGVGNVLTFNTTLLTIDPGVYGNGINNEGDYALLGVTGGVRSFNAPGPQTFIVVPNLGYMVQVGASVFGRFNINVAANGNVISLNTAAASGGSGTLIFNATRISVDPDGFVGQWFVVGVFGGSGTKLVNVVPGLSYQITTGSGTVDFLVSSPCVINPSQIVLGGFTFNITCGPPVANADPDQTVDEGTLATLDGSGSSASQGGPLTYAWTQVAGPSVTLNLSNPVHPTFTAPFVSVGGETLTFQLIVTEGSQNSQPDVVNIHDRNVNNRPVADAGADQTVDEGSPVMLNGSTSYDPDGETITFSWVQTVGPAVSLINANTATPEFYAPSVGASGATLTFQLTVSDGIDSATDSVDVFVENVNHKPISNAGPDQTRDEGTLVTLNGTGSGDPDGDVISYTWSQTAGPSVMLSSTTSPTPSFTAPLVNAGGTTLTFRLSVFDGSLSSNPDDAVDIRIVNINDPPVCNLAQPTMATLWPPNHKLISVGIVNVSDPNNDQVSISITSVTQDEPVNGLGDGDTSPDAVLQGDKVLLRVERGGNGNGRVYRVNFSANDGQGGVCSGSVNVSVPKSMQAGNSAVDDGQLYNSTLP